jgi:hypothetical protein
LSFPFTEQEVAVDTTISIADIATNSGQQDSVSVSPGLLREQLGQRYKGKESMGFT